MHPRSGPLSRRRIRDARLPALVLLCACAGSSLSQETDFEHMPKNFLVETTAQAEKAYTSSDFDQAFAGFRRAACAGEKNSQAMIGRMYLLGEGVMRDDISGYAWLVVAGESGLPANKQLARKVEDALSPEQRDAAHAKAQALLASYDSEHTKMSCTTRASKGGLIDDIVVCKPQVDARGKAKLHVCVG